MKLYATIELPMPRNNVNPNWMGLYWYQELRLLASNFPCHCKTINIYTWNPVLTCCIKLKNPSRFKHIYSWMCWTNTHIWVLYKQQQNNSDPHNHLFLHRLYGTKHGCRNCIHVNSPNVCKIVCYCCPVHKSLALK